MSNYKLAVLPGDGIGPEVMTEALNVLSVVSKKYNFNYETREALIGGAAYDSHGTPLPQETLEICHSSDAVLLGSIGGPRWDQLPPHLKPELGGLLALRKALSLYANIRPVVLFEPLKASSPLSPTVLAGPVDMVTVRELAGGIYFGEPKELGDDRALDTMVYTRQEVERIAKVAFELARGRRRKVTSVDKSNVLYSSMLWRTVVTEFSRQYPDVELEHLYVDNAAMQMILNPGSFDVILTSNLFGDILSDESAAICGTLGMLPSASLGQSIHLYEPAGGSAPDIAGQGIANPVAQILSVALLLDYSFGLSDASAAIFKAVERVLEAGYRTKDIASPETETVSTARMGQLICDYLS